MNNERKFYGLLNDVVFKYVFGRNENTKPLISLLNAILRLEGKDKIESIEVLNPFNYREYLGDKMSIVDTRVKDGNGLFYNIEVQNYNDKAFAQRVGYYLAKTYVGQIKDGDDYDLLKTATGIAFMDFELFGSKELHEKFSFKNEKSDITIENFMIIHFFNISKVCLEQNAENDNLYDRWLQTLRLTEKYDTMKSEISSLTQNEEGMIMAIELMNRANSDSQLRELIFDREESKRYSRYIIDSEVRARKAAEEKLKLAEEEAKRVMQEARQAARQAVQEAKQAAEQEVKQAVQAAKQAAEQADQKLLSVIQKVVNTNKKMGLSSSENIDYIMNCFGLTKEEAIQAVS